ncbi:MAG: protein kinase [Acidobacteria bacterium]|uniref:non-specific serine/threonine protein kinase n=1 Tax=Candidatus Sulfomarinibacter kjeldsenii TaxID=2885994 RepID=A0A8J6XWP8_9BACT|nr:protein kinase [Candidatus Sulfomarinibacter kjeldsenii]
MIGTTLSHFRITDKLGEGGMGEVWLAEDTRLGRKVALKTLPPKSAESEDRLRRFEDEARAASALNHPGIAHIYDVGEADGIHFIAMEHVNGESLDRRLARSTLTTNEITDIGVRLADALAAAHDQGVTHRDIKPSNLMMTPERRLKVLDFGLAKLRPAFGEGGGEDTAQTMTQPGVVMGTVQYMSPEQALGKDADHRSDIFSTGIVLYQMATGQLPFSGSTPTETITEIVRSEPRPVAELSPVSPPELERIVRKCLEKDPSRRYQSARELEVDLSNLKRDSESGVTVTAPARSAPSRAAILGVVAAAVLLVAIGFALIRSELWISRGGAIESIAVLPFENGTGDEESEYLCDGLTESLINTLSQIPDLKVISRRSTWAFKDSEEDPQSIGRKLGVQALLMGRLVQRGAQLAVSAELVDVADNHLLWGGRFNREQGDVLTIEQELTKTIAATLKIELSDDTSQRLDRRYAVDPEAHRLYLQGRQFAIGSSREMNKAVEYFQQAIAMDPGYVDPYAGLADAYMTQALHGVMAREEALEMSKAAVDEALAIDGSLAEALAASAERKYLFEWDWVGAENDLKRAVELNPGSDFARVSYAYFLSAIGRFDDAIEQATIAKEIDPLSPSTFHLVAFSLMGKREYARAAAEFRAALDLNPNWTWGYIKLAKTYADNGQCEEAFATAEDAEAELHGGDTPLARSWMGYTYGKCGDTERAEAALQMLDEFAENAEVDPTAYGIIYAALGDSNRLLDELERAVDDHSVLAVFMPAVPTYYMPGLENDPRFQVLMERTGFTSSGVHKGVSE